MPKEVLRTAAPAGAAPAAAAPAPAAASPHAAHLDAMEKRLRAMNLDEALITSALAAERKKLEAGGAAAKPAEKPAEKPVVPVADAKAAVVEKPAALPKPAAAPKPVAPPPSDEDFAAALAAEESGAHTEAPAESPGAAPEVEHEDEDATTQVVVQNHWSRASEGAITGPIDRSDFKTPQIKIVQGSGPLSQKFNQGTLIFMETAIFQPPEPDKPGPPMNFIPVQIQKYFRENLPSGSERQPRNAVTAEDVKRLGGTTEFGVDSGGNRVKPSWAPAARCLVIIERPEGCTHPAFTLEMEIDGKTRAFAAAVFFVNGGQYRAFVKPIMDATNFILCDGTGDARRIILEKRLWKMQVVKEKSGDNMVFNPKITMLPEATPADLKEYAKSLRG